MNDEMALRALTIGAALFVALATVTAIILYYNTARTSISNVQYTNINENYRDDIKVILFKDELTGVELKNVLQYFFLNKDVEISINSYYTFLGDTNTGTETIDPLLLSDSGKNINQTDSITYETLMKNIIPNQMFKNVNPNYEEDIYYFEMINK